MRSSRAQFPDAELFPNGLPGELSRVPEDYAQAQKWMKDLKTRIQQDVQGKQKPQKLFRQSARLSSDSHEEPQTHSASSQNQDSSFDESHQAHPAPQLSQSSFPASRKAEASKTTSHSPTNQTDAHVLPPEAQQSSVEPEGKFVSERDEKMEQISQPVGDLAPPEGYVRLPPLESDPLESDTNSNSGMSSRPPTPVEQTIYRDRPTPTLQIMRVNQADAEQLDSELSYMLKYQFVQIFRYFESDLLDRYGPEIEAGLQFLIWRFSIYKNEPSAGNQLQNLRYRDEWYKGPEQQSFDIPLRRRILHGILFIGFRWGWVRAMRMMTSEGYGGYQEGTWQKRVYNLARYLENLYKIFSLINFFHFLSTGLYRSLVDRLLGMRLVYIHNLVMRQISFEFMNQQLVWSSLNEFTMFLLPLINKRKIVRWVQRVLRLNQVKSEEDDKIGGCPICGDDPITTPYIASCGDIFCYYCLKAARMADQSQYRCQNCSEVITSQRRYVVGQQRQQQESRGQRLGNADEDSNLEEKKENDY